MSITMAATKNTTIRSLLQKPIVRIPLTLALGLVGIMVVLVVAAAIYNAFDEDLSADAQAMLVPPPMGKIDDSNGYIAFLGMVAPKGQDQMAWGRKAAAAYTAQAQPGFTKTPEWQEAIKSHFNEPKAQEQWCKPEMRDCIAEAKREGNAIATRLAEGGNAELLARYRKTRAAPEFADLYMGELLFVGITDYSALVTGAELTLADIAAKAGAGNFDVAVAELEREVVFHRRMIAGGHSIITVMIGKTLLTRDLLMISELLRTGGKRIAPYHARLRELTRPQISVVAIQPAFRHAAHDHVISLQHYLLRDPAGDLDTLDDLFIRPNETVNLMAAVVKAEVSIAGVPAAQYDREAAAIRKANNALLARPWYAEGGNPVGKFVVDSWFRGDIGKYAAQMHDLQALERMVDLQMTMATRGITGSAAIAAFVAAEGAKSHVDPYTDKAFAFDPEKRLLSFKPRENTFYKSGMAKRYERYGGQGAIAL